MAAKMNWSVFPFYYRAGRNSSIQNGQLEENAEHDRELSAYLAEREAIRYDRERETYENKCRILTEQSNKARETLMNLRTEYIRSYPAQCRR